MTFDEEQEMLARATYKLTGQWNGMMVMALNKATRTYMSDRSHSIALVLALSDLTTDTTGTTLPTEDTHAND